MKSILGDQAPVVSRPYRYDRVKQGIIDYHIEKMLKKGNIWPIQLPYASTVVLTRKNNDLPPDSPEAYRFAIDYRKVNTIIKHPIYPLPLIDDLITNIPCTTIMSTLDLKSGYFQLAINPRDIEKSAFITRNSTFEFGFALWLHALWLFRGGTKFSKNNRQVTKTCSTEVFSCYMNDVIITSPSFTKHVDHLNQVKTLKLYRIGHKLILRKE
ncbi:retrovirus-related Pol polyprotein from transposon 17.6 [Trichonephila clavipes]|nr:retrovirus-related Pol polyprotein from transposon 17.6 [Trichonephila clavipes]